MQSRCGSELRTLNISPPVSTDLINEEQSPDDWTIQSTFDMASPETLQSAVGNEGDIPRAFQELNSLSADFTTLFPDCATKLGTLGCTPYGTRVLASLFLLAAQSGGVARQWIKRSVEMKWTDASGSHSVVMTQGVS